MLIMNLKKLMFGDNPIINNFSGYEESVNKICRDDLVYHLKNILPQEIAVISCGGCDIEDFRPVTGYRVYSAGRPYDPLGNDGYPSMCGKDEASLELCSDNTLFEACKRTQGVSSPEECQKKCCG